VSKSAGPCVRVGAQNVSDFGISDKGYSTCIRYSSLVKVVGNSVCEEEDEILPACRKKLHLNHKNFRLLCIAFGALIRDAAANICLKEGRWRFADLTRQKNKY
jgi:hypothetical protein